MRFYKKKPNYDYNNRTHDEAYQTRRMQSIFAERCRSTVACIVPAKNKPPFEIVRYDGKKQEKIVEHEQE